jgi:hypothetical protein
MRSGRRVRPVLMALALALTCTPLWADDNHPAGADPPDPGFLEFLGSVDRLAELNPDYLSQADAAKAKPAKPGAQLPPPASPPPTPPPRPSSPPTAANATVGHNND